MLSSISSTLCTLFLHALSVYHVLNRTHRARNIAHPVKLLNFFTASPATLAAIGTGLVSVGVIMANQIISSKCGLFVSDVSQCNGPRKF